MNLFFYYACWCSVFAFFIPTVFMHSTSFIFWCYEMTDAGIPIKFIYVRDNCYCSRINYFLFIRIDRRPMIATKQYIDESLCRIIRQKNEHCWNNKTVSFHNFIYSLLLHSTTPGTPLHLSLHGTWHSICTPL